MSARLKVIHICHSDIVGGASRAAYRIHRCLLDADIDSEMWVNESISDDFTIKCLRTNFGYLLQPLKQKFISRLTSLVLKTSNSIIHSPAVWNSDWVSKINSSDADIVQLHWICNEMLSIRDISRIKKPIVWTMHDMWAFCGAEHYTDDIRWREGYKKNNRPSYEARFDLNRWTWSRKYRHWKNPMHIVCSSYWLAKCVSESLLMKNWPVEAIPTPINSEVWKPFPKNIARELLKLPENANLVLFGAEKGMRNHRKGSDLLLKSLQILSEKAEIDNLQLVVFGQSNPENSLNIGSPVHYMGYLHDDLSLRILYSAADVMIVPSLQENLSNAIMESLACGTPVVGFDIGGNSDMIEHKKNGYLSKTVDVAGLKSGIEWVFKTSKYKEICKNARKKLMNEFDGQVVSNKYIRKYKEVLK